MRSLKIFALLAALNTGAWIIPQEASAQVPVSFQLFYDELSPYGMWVDYPNYGYVWIPDTDPGFSPYATAGHWIFTDDGWTWVSDYPWGWAAFHYGRWDYDNVYGWFWVPDDEWGPAWVSWRRSPGYYGWAPLRPGISISISFGRGYHERNERWIFVRDRDISRSDIGRHYVNRSNNVTIINNSTVIVNTQRDSKRNATYIAGPGRDDVQKVMRTPVNSVAIRENDRPGQHLSNSELQIYRPQVQKKIGNGQNPAPPKVMKLNDVKPVSERNAGNRKQQPQNVAPPNKIQPQQPQTVSPYNSMGKGTQPQTVTTPNRVQQPKPQTVTTPNRVQQPKPQNVAAPNRGQQPKPENVAPQNKVQPTQPRNISPLNSRGKGKQPQTVAPQNKIQPTQPRNVNPSNSGVKAKQPQKAAQPNKNRNAQPRTNQDEKEKEKR